MCSVRGVQEVSGRHVQCPRGTRGVRGVQEVSGVTEETREGHVRNGHVSDTKSNEMLLPESRKRGEGRRHREEGMFL